MSPLIVGGRTIFGALSSQPTGITTTAGSEYYDTTDSKMKFYNGTDWAELSTTSSNFAGTDATHWWKNEGIVSATSWTAEKGGFNFAQSLNGSLTYSATDSNFNNLKSITNNTSDTVGLYVAGSAGDFWDGSSGYSVIVVMRKTQHNSGTSYGDCVFSQTRNDTVADGSLSIDLVGDHSWGGQYGEQLGYIAPPGSYPQKGILLLRVGANGANTSLEWWPAGGSSWSVRGTASSFANGVSGNNYKGVSLFNFQHGAANSHRYTGSIAEVAYFKNLRISDSTRDAWKNYIVSKFGF